MPGPVKYGLLGVCLLAATLIIVPALVQLMLYGLAIVGVAAIARKLVRLGPSPEEPVVGLESPMSATDTSIPDTPGRPR